VKLLPVWPVSTKQIGLLSGLSIKQYKNIESANERVSPAKKIKLNKQYLKIYKQQTKTN